MRTLPRGLPAVAGAAFLVAAVTVHGQPFDHEQCYKIKDSIKLSGIADLDAPQFNMEPGCKVGPAKFFCVPAEKTFVSAVDKTTDPDTVIPAPLPVYAPDATVDRICYKAKCPEPIVPPDTLVTDQFGTRMATKFKTKMICAPAVKGAAYCGDGIINGTEACDTPALGACPGTCESDCTCTCPTACCISEQTVPAPAETECIEYTGTPAQVGAFFAACGGTTTAPGAGAIHTPVAAPCGGLVGPTFGVPCGAPPPHTIFIPPDSSCP